MTRTARALVAMAIAVAAGCGGEPERLPPEMQQAAQPQPASPTPAPQESLPPTPGGGAAASASQPGPSGAAALPAAPAAAGSPSAAAAATPPQQSEEDEQWATESEITSIRQKAGVGMGRQGQGYGNDPITYPLAAYFRIRERIFVDQIKHAMDLYEATNGRSPQTQDEFRREIIQAGGMRMAVLPPGHKYFYDPAKGELLVVRTQ